MAGIAKLNPPYAERHGMADLSGFWPQPEAADLRRCCVQLFTALGDDLLHLFAPLLAFGLVQTLITAVILPV